MNQLPDKKNDKLYTLLKPDLLQQPSDNFTADIMSKLGIDTASASIKYQPVISKTGWIFISLISFLLIYFALTGNSGLENKSIYVAQQSLRQGTSALVGMFNSSIVLIMALSSIAAFILFSAESYYRKTRLLASN